MKKQYVPFLQWIMIPLIMMSCQGIDDVKPVANKDAEVYDYILSRGCPADKIKDAGDYYIADGDLIYPKSMNVRSQQSGAREEQSYVKGSLINMGSKRTIKVAIAASAAQYTKSIQEAMDQWNNINLYRGDNDAVPITNIKFIKVAPSGSEDITIFGRTTGFSSPTNLAYSYVPKYGYPGDRVLLNMNSGAFPTLSDAQKRGVIMHELGHTLGLEHTDWKQNKEKGYTNIPGTNGNDKLSIMNSTMETKHSFTLLTNQDRLAIRILYPAWPYKFKWDFNGIVATLSWTGPLHEITSFTIQYTVDTNDFINKSPVLKVINQKFYGSYAIPFTCRCSTYKIEALVRVDYVDGTHSGWGKAPTFRL